MAAAGGSRPTAVVVVVWIGSQSLISSFLLLSMPLKEDL